MILKAWEHDIYIYRYIFMIYKYSYRPINQTFKTTVWKISTLDSGKHRFWILKISPFFHLAESFSVYIWFHHLLAFWGSVIIAYMFYPYWDHLQIIDKSTFKISLHRGSYVRKPTNTLSEDLGKLPKEGEEINQEINLFGLKIN